MDQQQFHNVARETVALLDAVHDRFDVMVIDAEQLALALKQPGLSQERLQDIAQQLDGLTSETMMSINRAVGAITPLAVAGLNLQMVRYTPESGDDAANDDADEQP